MPPGINTFVLVADTYNLGMKEIDIKLMKGMLRNVLMRWVGRQSSDIESDNGNSGYPDRLHALYAGPVNMVVKMLFKLLSPIIPERLLAKVTHQSIAQEHKEARTPVPPMLFTLAHNTIHNVLKHTNRTLTHYTGSVTLSVHATHLVFKVME